MLPALRGMPGPFDKTVTGLSYLPPRVKPKLASYARFHPLPASVPTKPRQPRRTKMCMHTKGSRKGEESVRLEGGREWYLAHELAGTPGLPITESGVKRRAKAEDWRSRARRGRGGGVEYHISSLPVASRGALLLRAKRSVADAARATATDWGGWDQKPSSHQEEAKRRMEALLTVQDLVAHGTPKMAAYEAVARELGESPRTVRSWQRLVKGAHQGDWLPLLTPAWVGRTAFAEYDEEVYQLFRDLYLHPSQPPFTVCYERVQAIAAQRGLRVPSLSTLKREVERREDEVVVVLEREGERRAMELFPYLERDRSVFHAMEALNADGHLLDLDTVWPDGERCRTMLITFQDLHSNKIVGWRLAKAESAHEVGLAFLDVCDRWGVCEKLWVDNTLAMASKRMTAGAKGRKRFRDRDGDPIGVLPLLGVQVRFTMVAHGQSKPVERAFQDVGVNHISKHPAFEGAYLGSNPKDKPHNYGTRTISIAELEPVVSSEILAHNARPNRRTQVCAGRLSFDDAFEASYRSNAERIRRLSPAQRRLLYLVADVVTVQPDGCVALFGNRYWTEHLVPLRGRKVVVRYHPTERTLHDAVYVYGLGGEFLAEAPCYHKAGFADADAAERHNRARRQFLRRKKDLAKAQRRMEAAEIAAQVPAPAGLEEAPSDGVLRVDFGVPASLDRVPTVRRPSRQDAAHDAVAATLARSRERLDAELRDAARLAG